MKINSGFLAVSMVILLFCLMFGSVSAADVQGKIIGIEPGAGIMEKTEKAITDYDLDYTLVSSSSAGMASELTKAYEDGDWIVVTGWTPHWKFARFNLKYLEDPQGVYGGEEYIAALARTGFKEDNPGAYEIIDRFYWTPEDMTSVMLAIEDGAAPEDAAAEFVADNQEMVTEWIGDVSGEEEKVKIGYVLWDSEIASTNVLGKVLEQAGFVPELVSVDAGPLYQAVAKGDVDCTISAWLPVTHSTYLEKYGDDIVQIGTVMEGAKIGLVVPEYVTISSIDELNTVADKFQ